MIITVVAVLAFLAFFYLRATTPDHEAAMRKLFELGMWLAVGIGVMGLLHRLASGDL